MAEKLEHSDEKTEVILDSIADGVFTVGRDWKITSFNRAAEDITGIPREEAIGQRCCDVFRASICETNCALRETFGTGRPVVNKTVYIINNEGVKIPISVSSALLKDQKGNIIGGVETFRDLSALEELRKELSDRFDFHDIISKSKQMREIFENLPAISESDSTVLIEGESGTGKELIARAIHDLSLRKEKPLVTVNCAALPETLLESELFGYKAGAFTDARKEKPGRFARAEGGTMFLDEIAEIPPSLQVKLLRVLQEKTYEPLGSVEPVTADVRIIAATNKSLGKEVKEGKFREDLFYRVNVIKITLPPLRERTEDIPLLVEHFMNRFNNIKNKEISGVSPEVLSILLSYDFPGNIRELENIIEHAVVLCRSSIIDPGDLPEGIRPKMKIEHSDKKSFEELEAGYIKDRLEKNNWNRARTARELGVHKTTLWRKMKKLGIEGPSD